MAEDTAPSAPSGPTASGAAAGADQRANADGVLAARPKQPLWRQLLPPALALVLIGFVFARLDLGAFLAQLRRVDYPAFLAFATVFVVALLSADTLATVVLYRRSIAALTMRDFWVLRGASYLPSLLNHHVGQVFLTFFLSRAHQVPLARVFGATLLAYASWTGCLLGLAAVAVLVAGLPAAWLLLPLGAGVVYLVVIAWRPAALARTTLLAPLFEAGVGGHLVALIARVPHLVVLFAGTWLPFFFFGVDVPPSAALVKMPQLMVVVTLPLTPQGFGTRDVLAAQLLEPFAAGATHQERLAAIAAATMAWGIAITLVEAAVGMLLMRQAMKRLARGAATPPPAD